MALQDAGVGAREGLHVEALHRRDGGAAAVGKAPATRRQYAQVIHKVLALAVWPLQLIETHPLRPRGRCPSSLGEKAKGYPFRRKRRGFWRAPEAPYARRLFYGFPAREVQGMASLAWRDLDLTTGELTLDREQDRRPAQLTLDPGVGGRWSWVARRATRTLGLGVRDNGRPMSIERWQRT